MWETILEGGVAMVIGTVAVAGVITVYVVRKLFGHKKTPAKVYPPDVVILHDISRGPWIPSGSPFPVKLETYLRMANIPYQVEHSLKLSSKGKIPWITYNGVEVADSQFCIEYLNRELGLDLDKHLSDKDKAVARAFRMMIETNTYWAGAVWRWDYGFDLNFLKTVMPGIPTFLFWQIQKEIKKQAHSQGMGRHSKEEVIKILIDDFKALSAFLGNKDFLMGSEPSEVDCAVFGSISQVYWYSQSPNSPHEKIMKEELQNLCDYCERMKTRFWPDWDECITHGSTKEVTA